MLDSSSGSREKRRRVRSLYPIGYTRQAVITRTIGDDLRSSLTYVDCKAANLI